MKSLQRISVNPANAIMVIVDIENDFCKPGGKLYSDAMASLAPGVIDNTQKMADRVRKAGIPVIYIQSVRTLHEPEITVFGHSPYLQVNTWGSQIVDELKPQPQDIVIQKWTHDPFYKTEFDKVLSRVVPDPTRCCAMVTGGGVNVCVYHTVMGLHVRDFWVVVLDDCVYYKLESYKRLAFEQFSHPTAYLNVFLSRSDLIETSAEWKQVPPSLVPGT